MLKTYKTSTLTTRDRWNNVWSKFPLEKKLMDLTMYPIKHIIEYIKPGHRVLEAGVGLGRVANNLIHMNASVIGMDYVLSGLIRIRNSGAKYPLVAGDICGIPIKNNYFNILTAFGLFHCLEELKDQKKGLEEVFRVLKPGGIFISSVGNEDQFIPIMLAKLFYIIINPVISFKEKFFKFKYQDSQQQIFYKWKFKKNEWENIVKSAGFEIIKCEPSYKIKTFYNIRFFHPRYGRSQEFRTSEPKFTLFGSVLFKFFSILFPWSSCDYIVCIARKPNRSFIEKK